MVDGGGRYFCHGLVTPDVGYGWVDGCSQPAITHICIHNIRDVGKGVEEDMSNKGNVLTKKG